VSVEPDLRNLFLSLGTRVFFDPANFGVTREGFTLLYRVAYRGTPAADDAPNGYISRLDPAGVEVGRIGGATIPDHYAQPAGAVFCEMPLDDIIRPDESLGLVGSMNEARIEGYSLRRNIVEQWCAARNRPVP